MDYGMKPARLISTLTLSLLVLLALSPIRVSGDAEEGGSFENAIPIDVSNDSIVTLSGNLSSVFSSDRFYLLKGLKPGVEVRVEGWVRGVESALTTVSLYSYQHARITGVDQIVGSGQTKDVSLRYLPAKPHEGEVKLYLRVGKADGKIQYELKVTTETFFDAGSETDAEPSIEGAMYVGRVSEGEPVVFRGYISDREYGEDFSDCYSLDVELKPGLEVNVEAIPEGNSWLIVLLKAWDGFTLKSGKSMVRGEPVSLKQRGDWREKTERFYVCVENLGGSYGGGWYDVRVWLTAGEKYGGYYGGGTEETPTQTQPSVNVELKPTSIFTLLEDDLLRNMVLASVLASTITSSILAVSSIAGRRGGGSVRKRKPSIWLGLDKWQVDWWPMEDIWAIESSWHLQPEGYLSITAYPRLR